MKLTDDKDLRKKIAKIIYGEENYFADLEYLAWYIERFHSKADKILALLPDVAYKQVDKDKG